MKSSFGSKLEEAIHLMSNLGHIVLGANARDCI